MKKAKSKYLSTRIRVFILSVFIYMGIVFLIFFLLFLKKKTGIILPVLAAAILLLFLYVWHRYVYKVWQECENIMKLFANNYMVKGIFEQRMNLTPGNERAIRKFGEIMNTAEMINATKKQAEYMALQNQINPHFLYNTLEGIRGETLHAGLNHVAQMTEALATFFRYTISNMENLVTLEDELENIHNYYIIQQYRFGDRLTLHVEYEEEDEERLMKCRLPKLTLQPIVENAVCHGIEYMVTEGIITIKIEITEKRLIIIVSDNGVGMSKERKKEIEKKLNEMRLEYISTDKEDKGGIAMLNVNNRIRLLCGEEYGIHIYSILEMGTDVEITLPLIMNEARECMNEKGSTAI